MTVTVQVDTRDGVQDISLAGRLDSKQATSVEPTLSQAISGGASGGTVINLAGMEYISSAGLRLILVMAKTVQKAGGRIALYGLPSHIREVFEISGFLTILTVRDTREDAVLAVS